MRNVIKAVNISLELKAAKSDLEKTVMELKNLKNSYDILKSVVSGLNNSLQEKPGKFFLFISRFYHSPQKYLTNQARVYYLLKFEPISNGVKSTYIHFNLNFFGVCNFFRFYFLQLRCKINY